MNAQTGADKGKKHQPREPNDAPRRGKEPDREEEKHKHPKKHRQKKQNEKKKQTRATPPKKTQQLQPSGSYRAGKGKAGQIYNREANHLNCPDAARATLDKRIGVWGVPTEQARSNIIAATTIEKLCDVNTPPILERRRRVSPFGGSGGKLPWGLGGEKTAKRRLKNN
jgi:hypothetical protein